MASDDKGDIPRLEPIEAGLAAVEDAYGQVSFAGPTFCGEEDAEQFIAEINDVAAICRWPTRVTLIQLWLCLTGSTKPYCISQDFDSIFERLRARFGLTARDAPVQLQGLKRDPMTPL